MIIQKLFVYLLVAGLIFQTIAVAAPIKTLDAKKGELSPKLKQNALQLLSSVSRETRQLGLAENRSRARIVIADLMWQHDEAAARLVYQCALSELRNLLGQATMTKDKRINDSKNGEHSPNLFRLNDLRREYVLTLASHDSAAAVDALGALKTNELEFWDPLSDRYSLLKFETAAAIAVKDPNRAYTIYQEEITANGITQRLTASFDELQRVNPELTAKIFKDIFAVIETAKITGFSDDEKTTNADAESSKPSKFESWQVALFLNSASKLKRRAERDQKILPPLTEAEIRELAELLARKFLNISNPRKHSINQAMTAITRHAPDQVLRINEKVGAEGVRSYQDAMATDNYHLRLEEKNADELAQIASRTANSHERETLYKEAALKALAEIQTKKAQTIAARIKNRDERAWLMEKIEAAESLAVARRGNEAEVRKLIARLKSEEKILDVWLEFVAALAAKGDIQGAKKRLNEIRKLTAKAETADELMAEKSLAPRFDAVGKLAGVSILVEPDETFIFIEAVIELANVAIKRNQSADKNSVAAKEFFYDEMEQELLLHTPQTIDLLKNLARADFERTVKLIDKFERPEIRYFARLRLVQALLDARAAQKEKEMYEELLSEINEQT